VRLLIAIDGACRRNGKPDCTASGGVFIQGINDDGQVVGYATKEVHEYGSTNQRGELLALLKALQVVYRRKCEAQIVTDSEYLFNAMTKQWYKSWQSGSWLTRDGYGVKNKDIWVQIAEYANGLERDDIEVIFYHIKGHCIPFGTVTARNALVDDSTGEKLYKLVCDKFDAISASKRDTLDYASTLSMKNNGFPLDLTGPTLKNWVTVNVVADAIATKAVDEADSRRET
jgi:ribonuclease HI